jgi:hypothetical protein
MIKKIIFFLDNFIFISILISFLVKFLSNLLKFSFLSVTQLLVILALYIIFFKVLAPKLLSNNQKNI